MRKSIPLYIALGWCIPDAITGSHYETLAVICIAVLMSFILTVEWED